MNMNICEFCGKEIRKGLKLYGYIVCGPCHKDLTRLKNQTCATCHYYDGRDCRYSDLADHFNYQTFTYNGVEIHIPVDETDSPTSYNSCYHYKIDKSVKISSLDEEVQNKLNSIDFNKEDYYPSQFIMCNNCSTTTEIERDQPFICSQCGEVWEGD